VSARPLFLFAPGAGAPSTHPWMEKWRDYLSNIGEVVLFDYLYMSNGSRRPDPLPQLIATHRAALTEARERHKGPVFLAGKSMGGRIGCHVSLEEQVSGLICFGYPLCGAGDRSRMRDAVLRKLTTPILFLQGTRDNLCPLDLLEEVRAGMTAPTRLHVVADGDHSLMAAKRRLRAEGITQEAVDRSLAAEIEEFAQAVLAVKTLSPSLISRCSKAQRDI
jgi:predicted alpha/beta-hydrolase family hydrolase